MKSNKIRCKSVSRVCMIFDLKIEITILKVQINTIIETCHVRLTSFLAHVSNSCRRCYLISAELFMGNSWTTYRFPRHFSRCVFQGWAALKPGMLQHVRRRRTVWRAILHHGYDQIPKNIQARLREPQISRPKRIYSLLQCIHDTPIFRRSCCDVSANASPKTDLIKEWLGLYSQSLLSEGVWFFHSSGRSPKVLNQFSTRSSLCSNRSS